jgi:hypothetical protein
VVAGERSNLANFVLFTFPDLATAQTCRLKFYV